MSGRRDLASILEDIASELRRANDLAEERMRDSAKDVLYTPSEAAEYMGKTVRTLENYDIVSERASAFRRGKKAN